MAVLLFASDRAHLRDAFYRVLTALQGGVAGGPVQTTGHVGSSTSSTGSSRSDGHAPEVGVALLAYALLEGVEAIGLWLGKRWAEYLTFISTTVLLPLEIYEIINRGTVLKVIGFLINLAVVVYLLLRKRLFGLRGGGAADEAEREHDGGWEAIERATPGSPTPPAAATEPVSADELAPPETEPRRRVERGASARRVASWPPPSPQLAPSGPGARRPSDGDGLQRPRAAGGAVSVRRRRPRLPLAR